MSPDPITVHHGDALEVLRTLPDNSVDAIVTDPPAGIAFMGRAWDGDKGGRAQWVAWFADVMAECLRVAKPGAHALVWALPRTSHWTACGLEDAGWAIRDRVSHLFGSGFPKSLNVGDGRGTALKPAAEDWWLVRKPFASNVAANVQQWGTGALNIDATRVESGVDYHGLNVTQGGRRINGGRYAGDTSANLERREVFQPAAGRWPTNVLFSHQPLLDPDTGEVVGDACESGCVGGCPVAELDAQSGNRPGAVSNGSKTTEGLAGTSTFRIHAREQRPGYADQGGASRFFPTFRYQAKAPSRERPKVNGIAHPTCKPRSLMSWLVKLVTPPGGVVLDPFAGSGTTAEACLLEGFRCIAIEREADYLPLIAARLNRPVQPAIA